MLRLPVKMQDSEQFCKQNTQILKALLGDVNDPHDQWSYYCPSPKGERWDVLFLLVFVCVLVSQPS